jgi:transaldolase
MTEIFLDTANMDEIRKYKSWGILQGLTTNQKIFLKEKGCNFKDRALEILEEMYPMHVSLEGPNDYAQLIKTAEEYCNWVDKNGTKYRNVVIKVPMLGNGDGLRAVKTLSEMGIKTNVTACMTLNQTFLAACAGATYVSLFFNRMIDMEDVEYALNVVKTTKIMLHDGQFDTRLIVGSIRQPFDIPIILMGQPDIITIPPKILEQMPLCERTEETLKDFEEAWKEFKKYESK